uniref:E2 domain-containing protein n=1 Tax=Romanomermis culicivorax TaxID=13658 RepID=A0A915L1B5_ROMCU
MLNAKATLLGAQKFSANKSDESSEESDDESDAKPVESLDVYFRVADPDNEHEAHQKAIERLEKKHKNKISTVMQEWSELEKRYNAMLQKDPKHAQSFRHEMTTRFQKTIAALEGERKDQRRQIEEVHQQRVESTLNERKRDAIKRYRDSLADSKRSSPRILRYLESYIRAEEKDRVHALNRYIHLLKTDSEQAFQWKALLLRKLHDIDLRVNGTVTLLKELPAQLEAKIKKSAYEFWHKFRLEHTPEVSDETLIRLDYTFNDRLLNAYEKRYKAEIKDKLK